MILQHSGCFCKVQFKSITQEMLPYFLLMPEGSETGTFPSASLLPCCANP